MEWSYQLLDEHERRVFRAVSVFPGPFTLEAAEAVAGPDARLVVLRLVDCSLLVPPQAGPDGRSRYAMLETLRAYGSQAAGRGGRGWTGGRGAGRVRARRWPAQATTGLQASTGEVAAGRWLDAEDATMRQVLAWAVEHDAGTALRLAVALAPWWLLRGRLAGQYPLLREVAGQRRTGRRTRGTPRSTGSGMQRCTRLTWPGRWTTTPRSGTPPGTRDRPGHWLTP